MTKTNAIERLREEAKKNSAANAVFHIFALRQRTRGIITIHSLTQKMKKEGFEYGRQEYVNLLKLLAELGFGKLEEKRGRIKALRDITVTLQSLGEAVLNKNSSTRGFNKRNKFTALPGLKTNLAPKPMPVEAAPTEVSVTFDIRMNDKVIATLVPKDLTDEEMTTLVKRLRGAAA